MRKFTLLLCLLCTLVYGYGQRTITGTVTDAESAEPLIGATILILSTSTGTVTDFDGAYSLEIPDGDVVLAFSYVGYQSQEISVGTQEVLDVQLQPDVLGLETIVVLGYLPTRRKDITGSVSSVASADIANTSGLGIQNVLQGRTSGVVVTKASGTPGSSIDVRVRGSSSINAGNQPLFVLDGVPLISGNFSQVDLGGQVLNALTDINPNDIESIEVLKDASTASIYGSRGANGVVLITTKRGKAGPSRIDFNASYGWQFAPEKIPMQTPDQYREMLQELWGDPDFLAGALDGNTDWQEEIFRTSNLQDYSLNVSGGDERTRFFAGLSYLDEEGIIRKAAYERYSARLNVDHIVSDKFSLGGSVGYSHSKNLRIQNDNNVFGTLSVAMLWPANVPVYNDDGSWGSAGFGFNNPVASVTIYDNVVTTNRVTGNFFGKYQICEHLAFKATVGLDAFFLREDVFEPSALLSSATGTARLGHTQNSRWITDYTLNFQRRFGMHSIDAVVGAGYQEDQIDQSFAQVDGFPTDDFTGLTSGASLTNILGGFSGDRLNSYFGHVHYTYDDRYIVTATFRADGSSRFINDKWGYFPGLSVAWRISNEDFLSIDQINELKIRVGWGQTGNNGVGNFSSRQLFGGGANYLNEPGIIATQLGNPDLTWETTTQYNVGIDFAVCDYRLAGNIDFYIKNTDDLLLERPIPTTSGFTTVPENIGEVRNSGIELNLTGYPFRIHDGLNWEVGLQLGYNKNEIQKLYNSQPIDLQFATRLAEGHPVGAFYGHLTDGIFQNMSEIDAHATQPGAAPGDIRFVDLNTDGKIDDDDRTFIGQGLPDWMGGVTNILSYKGIELSTFLQFSIGNDIYNWNRTFNEGMNLVFNTTREAWENRWQQDGDQTDIPRAALGDPNANGRNSTRFVENGSYLRLKTATLAYNLPTSWLGNSGISNLRIYVTGQNVFTITDYSWFDPEVNSFGTPETNPGYDFFTFPQARSVLFGVNVSF